MILDDLGRRNVITCILMRGRRRQSLLQAEEKVRRGGSRDLKTLHVRKGRVSSGKLKGSLKPSVSPSLVPITCIKSHEIPIKVHSPRLPPDESDWN